MSLIVKTITRFVSAITMVFGAYIILHGHLTPGGGFAGGVILASGFILITLAFGADTALKILPAWAAAFFESLGGLIFLGLALFGISGGFFFLNFLPAGEAGKLFSGGFLPLCNIAVGMKVGSALFAVFTALAILRIGGGK